MEPTNGRCSHGTTGSSVSPLRGLEDQDLQPDAAIEYGLIAALIAIAAIPAIQSVGTSLSSTFSTIASSL